HMLVGPADVGSHNLQNHPVRRLFAAEWIGFAFGHSQLRIGDRRYLDCTRLDVGYSAIGCHVGPLLQFPILLLKRILRLSSSGSGEKCLTIDPMITPPSGNHLTWPLRIICMTSPAPARVDDAERVADLQSRIWHPARAIDKTPPFQQDQQPDGGT